MSAPINSNNPAEVGIYLGVTDLADVTSFVAFAEEVERLGYYGVSMPHSIARDFPRVDTLVMLSAAAARTHRVRLNIAAIQIPLYAPVALARMLMSIERLSGGRLDIAAAVGWVPKEFENLGIPYKERGSRTDETLEIMQRLWSAEEEVNHQGRHFQLKEVRLTPKPIQQPLPILIGGGYHLGLQGAPGEAPRKAWNEASFRRMARFGQGWCTA
ncbi:MAG: LLM class flavin-dependent oxidoreductase, partial [Burkholderiales bacterium]